MEVFDIQYNRWRFIFSYGGAFLSNFRRCSSALIGNFILSSLCHRWNVSHWCNPSVTHTVTVPSWVSWEYIFQMFLASMWQKSKVLHWENLMIGESSIKNHINTILNVWEFDDIMAPAWHNASYATQASEKMCSIRRKFLPTVNDICLASQDH